MSNFVTVVYESEGGYLFGFFMKDLGDIATNHTCDHDN